VTKHNLLISLQDIFAQKDVLMREDENLEYAEGRIKSKYRKNSTEYRLNLEALSLKRKEWKIMEEKFQTQRKYFIMKNLVENPNLLSEFIDEEFHHRVGNEDFSIEDWVVSHPLYAKTYSYTNVVTIRDASLWGCLDVDGNEKTLYCLSNDTVKNEVGHMMYLSHSFVGKPRKVFFNDSLLKRKSVFVELSDCDMTLNKWCIDRSISQLRIMILKLVHAFTYIHSQDVIHGNIDFDSILVRQDGNPMILGFAYAVQSKNIFPDTGSKKERKSHYVAPEFNRSIQFVSDVWSFGVILYEMCHGFGKFGFVDVSNSFKIGCIPHDNDGKLAHLLKRILVSDPKARPTFQELLLDPLFFVDVEKSLQVRKNLITKAEKFYLIGEKLPKLLTGRVDRFLLKRNDVTTNLINFYSNLLGSDLLAPTNVSFEGEKSIDLGGPSTEMFVLFFSNVLKRTCGIRLILAMSYQPKTLILPVQ
jgi:serine/threonine protein kinase